MKHEKASGTRQWRRWIIIALCVIVIVINQLCPRIFNNLFNPQFDAFSITLAAVAIFFLFRPYFGPTIGFLDRMHKRWVIIVICLTLVALRILLPDAQVDINSIWLIGIAAFLFVLPDLKTLAPYVKRIKVGDTEIELKESIDNLAREVERAQDIADTEPEAEAEVALMSNVSSEIEQVLEESAKDPRSALLLLSAKIENQVRRQLEEADLIAAGKPYSLGRYVELGVKKGIFSQEILPAFQDFWTVRNRVVHGAAFDVEDSYILSLISLGTQLLKLASTSKKRPDQEEYSPMGQ